ncbi:MAG: outer membrane protein transport protein [Bacteroidetes bacterium]|nr:outer membrane protein transport protein [Bacteroidota bacterium]
MQKQVFIFSLLAILVSTLQAQTDIDALRFATPSVQGTARDIAVGNTMGTIGAEISALSTNPAGIAKFSSTEFSFTPALSINKTTSTYLNNSSKKNKVNFQINNLGIIVSSRYSNTTAVDKWNGIKFGFALNRLANFNNEYHFGGLNTQNSLLTHYGELLKDRNIIQSEDDAKTKYPFGASIAYLLGLITSDSLGNIYTATDSSSIQQDFIISRKGGINELAIGVGSMYKDKIMVGASIGVPIINFTEQIYLVESDVLNNIDDLNNYSNLNYLKTRGVGFNLKVGIIGMPIRNLRLSLALQTPSVLFMKDAFSTSMEVDYASQSVILTGDSPDGASKYKYIQPWKMTTGIGYIHKYGFVSVEYELSDVANSKFKFNLNDDATKDYQQQVNNTIKGKYGLTHTIKAGIEFKYDPIRIRAGVQYRTSPFKKSAEPTNISTSTLTYSAGFGYRAKKFFVDIAYYQTNQKELFVPYSTNNNDTPQAVLSSKKPAIALTVGYKL